MARNKVDLVIEAVRYASSGEIDWVRAYQRRGHTFSDDILIPRSQLVAAMKAGKLAFAGSRVELNASTFVLTNQIELKLINGKEILYTANAQTGRDCLEGVPLL